VIAGQQDRLDCIGGLPDRTAIANRLGKTNAGIWLGFLQASLFNAQNLDGGRAPLAILSAFSRKAAPPV
jgi:hypothetical protein